MRLQHAETSGENCAWIRGVFEILIGERLESSNVRILGTNHSDKSSLDCYTRGASFAGFSSFGLGMLDARIFRRNLRKLNPQFSEAAAAKDVLILLRSDPPNAKGQLQSRSLVNQDEVSASVERYVESMNARYSYIANRGAKPKVTYHSGREAFVEQVALFRHAQLIVGVHGA